MKKTTWLLLAISLVAMLLVAGCTPTTPAPTASPSPSPSPTVAPTPKPDKECPKVVSTTVTEGTWTFLPYTFENAIKLTVTFDEPVTSTCIENTNKWDITIKNDGRKDKLIDGLVPAVVDLSDDGKKVDVYFWYCEPLSYVVKDVVYQIDGVNGVAEGVFTIYDEFCGLICSEDEADEYAKPSDETIIEQAGYIATGYDDIYYDPTTYEYYEIKILNYDLVSGPSAPKYADTVEWKLKNCVVSDELGNQCCDYSGSACCLEPTCEECGCPIGSEVPCQ